jgi:hypothetical protein
VPLQAGDLPVSQSGRSFRVCGRPGCTIGYDKPVEWRGRHQWGNGQWDCLVACDGHTDGLVGVRRIALTDRPRASVELT